MERYDSTIFLNLGAELNDKFHLHQIKIFQGLPNALVSMCGQRREGMLLNRDLFCRAPASGF